MKAPGVATKKGPSSMQHWLIISFVDFLLWIDTLSRKKLERVVPNLEELLTHPEETLAVQDITIHPARRYGSGGCMGLLVGLACAIPAALLMNDLFGPPRGQRPHPAFGIVCLAILLLIVVLSVILMVRFYRGGHMVLTPRGVELWYRSVVVCCPWGVFNATGQPAKTARDRLIIPVSATAVPSVEAWKLGAIVGSGAEVRTYQWKLKSESAAVMKDHYQVRDSLNLAKVLLAVGRALGKN